MIGRGGLYEISSFGTSFSFTGSLELHSLAVMGCGCDLVAVFVKAQRTSSQLSSLMDQVARVNGSGDTSELVSRQDLADRAYPPPQCQFRPPELPPPKLPDSPPVHLVTA